MSGYVDPLIQRLDISLVLNGLTLASLEYALASFGCVYNYQAKANWQHSPYYFL